MKNSCQLETIFEELRTREIHVMHYQDQPLLAIAGH